MIKITIPPSELWDDNRQEFITITEPIIIPMEHSLVSIHEWEKQWHKPFLKKFPKKTTDETVSYLACMSLRDDVDPKVFYAIPKGEMERINKYIEDPMSARTKSSGQRSAKRETITAELIYFWMFTYNIPYECREWHLNSLLSLIELCSIKNTPPKKMSASQKYAKYNALNNARRKAFHTKG